MEINSTAVRYNRRECDWNTLEIFVDSSVQYLENDGTNKPDTESCCYSTQCQLVCYEIRGRGFSSLGIDMKLLDRKPDVQKVRAHETQIP